MLGVVIYRHRQFHLDPSAVRPIALEETKQSLLIEFPLFLLSST